MRHHTLLLAALLLAALCVPASAQDASKQPAGAGPIDEVSRQATDLEAELGKYNDKTPEAAEVMVKLADLYHAHARQFGLIRVATRFVAAHPNDPRHQAMMLKLLDGLEATSRNKDFTVYARQFVARYPQAPQVAEVEQRLAKTLDQMPESIVAADAWRDVWKRSPNAQGREAGAQAVALYGRSGNHEHITQAAELAEEMFDELKKLPKDRFAEECGWKAFWEWRRINQWARSNVVGQKLLAAGMPKDKDRQWMLHRYMAENHWNQNQHANAVESIRKALAIKDDQYLQYQLVERLHNAGANAAEIEQAAGVYFQKYPDREDRWNRRILVAHAYQRGMNTARAVQILRECLPHDAHSYGAASNYVSWSGTEPAQVAEVERVLLDAIAKNPKHAFYLRYVLGFNVYRDRMKDEAKARQVLRDLVMNSPSDDGHTSGAIGHLLSRAVITEATEKEKAKTTYPVDATFQADVDHILAARTKHIHMSGFRRYPADWVKSVRRREELKARADYLAAKLAAQDQDPYVATWLQVKNGDYRDDGSIKARERLLQPDDYAKLSDEAAWQVLHDHAYYYRHYVRSEDRPRSAKLYGQMAQRFPKRLDVATWYLQSATDYAPPEVQKLAAEHYLKFPPSPDADAWRRLMIAADRNMSADLAKRSLAWIKQAEQKHGKNPSSAGYIGDVLAKLGMTAEAQQHWKDHLDLDPSNSDCYACAERLLAQLRVPQEEVQKVDPNDPAQQPALQALRQKQEAFRQQRIAFLRERLKVDSDYHGRYAQLVAMEYLPPDNPADNPPATPASDAQGKPPAAPPDDPQDNPDLKAFEDVLRQAIARAAERPFRSNGFDEWIAQRNFYEYARNHKEMKTGDKLRVYRVVRDLPLSWASAAADLALLEHARLGAAGLLEPKAVANPSDSQQPAAPPTMENFPVSVATLLEFQDATRAIGDGSHPWDVAMHFVQNAMGRKDYQVAATLLTGMLGNIASVDTNKLDRGRELVAQVYSRMGAVGLTIDENSPIAPLLQAALYLRLGDRDLAFETYLDNKALFNEHRAQVPVDLLLFVCENHIAAGGDENFALVEEILRTWLVRHSESKEYDESTKAKVQLLLAKNCFRAQRYDIARTEYQTVIGRYAGTPQAIEAEFGIGETFMAQKVYDQAEAIFEKLANSRDADVTVRAEFLRGVLAYRRGDKDEARDIFRTVLERVPNMALANQALFNLAEVYGDEERYMDQLNLLRTVGRLGQASKRWHRPGTALSIVVQDSDLGISRGAGKVPVRIRTEPGGDEETIFLTSGGAGKGLFRADLDTRLGSVTKGDGVLQLTGKDVIRCDYPEDFKQEFKHVALSDAEIKIAADAEFKVASSKIIDEEEETFSERLAREQREREQGDQRVSQIRPANQIKPGNIVYFRSIDPDRDLSDDPDTVTVKLAADSGDQVQVTLTETEPHSGIFEGTAQTAELPAGALASDTAIEHSPLMSIDKDPKSFWLSEPDGATPKSLTVDMKDLKTVSRTTITTPNAESHAPVRGRVLGSNDGLLWFYLAGHPRMADAAHPDFGTPRMTRRLFEGNHYSRTDNWGEVLNLAQNGTPIDAKAVDALHWSRAEEEELAEGQRPRSYAAVWSGTLVQDRPGAVRIAVQGHTTALAVDGRLELPLGQGNNRHADVWLESGPHKLTVFAAGGDRTPELGATLMRADYQASQVRLHAFGASDFDLNQPAAQAAGKDESSQPAAPNVETAPLQLLIASAELQKKTEQFGLHESGKRQSIGHWQSMEDRAAWTFRAPRAGRYAVVLELSHDGGGSHGRILLGGPSGQQTLQFTVPNTDNWETYQPFRAGVVEFPSPGEYTLTIEPESLDGGGSLMNLAGVTFEPSTGESVIITGGDWAFEFQPKELRYVRFQVDEYLGEAVAISNVIVSDEDRKAPFIPTETDVLALAQNDTLEIAGGDRVTATYTDEFTQTSGGRSRLLTGTLTATYYNALVTPIAYDFVRQPNGAIEEIRKELMRIDPGGRLIVEIVDYDQDRSNERDTVSFEVVVNDGEPLRLTATETEEYSGIFTKEVDTSAAAEPEKLQVKPGDRIFCRYIDEQNTFPGHSVPREGVVYVAQPTPGRIAVLETRVAVPPEGAKSKTAPRVFYQHPAEDVKISGVAFEAPLTVEVIDPDAARDSLSTVTVTLVTTDGATVDVECEISNAFADAEQPAGVGNWPLREGRFVGQVILQLGGSESPVLVPLSANMPRNLVGGPVIEDESLSDFDRNLVTKVLNLTGQDVITATYEDQRRPADDNAAASGGRQPAVVSRGRNDEPEKDNGGLTPPARRNPRKLTAQGRLISNGELAVLDRDYESPVEQLHVGERLFLMITDADRDTSDERDTAAVAITTEFGEQETIELAETLAHSGVFTGSLTLGASDQPTPGNFDIDEPALETYFGDTLRVQYTDPTASTETGTLEILREVPVVIGTDGLVAAFSKTFSDEQLAVETKFHIAESYFELFKSHKTLGRTDEQTADLEAGRRVLREVMEDYPDPKYVPRIAYLLGQFSQELEQWDEAIESYEMIVRQFPEHSLAPDAQYKLAQAYEESGDFDNALEAYVTLAATYPKSPLIASVMIRISDHFYKNEVYDIAAQVGEKFLEKFEAHEHASRMAFRIGQCHYKAKKFTDAGEAFDRFCKKFPDAALAPDAFFWAGESYRMANNNREAFQRYNMCRYQHSESEAAKYARGRLALPEMLQQFEADANSIETP